MEELSEVITTSVYSCYNDYNIIYGTSKSLVKMIDIRENCICSNNGLIFSEP